MSITALENQIDNQITDKTIDFSIDNVEVGETLKDILNYNYIGQVYKAKLSQSGIGNITATILKNNTGLTFTYARNSTGNYNLVFSSLVTDLNKMDIIVNFQTGAFTCPQINIDNLGILATLETKYWNGSNFVLSDDIINNATIYIILNE